MKDVVMGNACSMHGEIRSLYKILVWKSKGKRALGGKTAKWILEKFFVRIWDSGQNSCGWG